MVPSYGELTPGPAYPARMPSLRPVAVVLAIALLPACHAEPEAKYPASLGACELLPREAAIRVTDAGAKLSAAQEKESHILLPYKYCLWDYKQSRKSFWSAYQPGPIGRQLTINVQVVPADSGGAPAAVTRYDGDRDSHHHDGSGEQAVPGIGEAAFASTSEFQGHATGLLEFRRSNAVVTIRLSGRDCCVRKVETDMQAANRRRILLAVGKTADQTLLTR